MTVAFITTLCSSAPPSDAAGTIRDGADHHMGSIRRPEAWFVKIVCTVFARSSSLDRFVGYFSKHLTPSIVSEVVHRFTIVPALGFKVVEFTKDKLKMKHSSWTYNFLLRSLCESDLHGSAKLVYDWMKFDGQFPDSYLLGFLVSSYAQAGRFDISKELLADSQCNYVGVNDSLYHHLFDILIRQNKVGDAVVLFRELVMSRYCPKIHTVNLLMRGLCRAGVINEAFKLLGDLRSFGCLPNIITYNTLIHGLCQISEVCRARSLMKEVWLKGELAPDVYSYTTIISGYCKLGETGEGVKLFDEMTRSGIRPNRCTFNALIDGFVKSGKMDSALAMYAKMSVEGCPPDVVTFTSLIYGYFGVGQVKRALEIWRKMNDRHVSANIYTFSALVSGLCKMNRLHEARNILRLMNQSGIVPKPFVYNHVIDVYCKSGNVDEANRIVAEMEEKRCKPDKVTYTSLIIGHCTKGRMLEAIGIFDRMLVVGCTPDEITVNDLTSRLLKAGMPSEAARIKKALWQNHTLGTSLKKKSYHQSTNADMPIAVY
ncbi:pentatricopeptide repeat-containing protein At2g06000-like [Lotus japonicus]|uniref:pentatricopeptide repeat-containing protein At2g06000-like n=1 Tax=Lotus japonicus TaxID=34305 RepID=UPI002590168C|nr:pentatricopeptide repeat-containing protein At2g06000-like [Lotus japonicus]XP_057430322.1 pentatricopeptide repeat-containing protein At2g06000-like [Lotus japonicus]XP_057430323.1 pentatricopeptide repeat-containing protein At2g06000-like [Lotus japonicus]XP_057430324.1 pentatricopeptide repeat-containing protein At2g06000-like [Lotus japonicus]XP_057430325.1 pentatricopeptide repeat-containing protein At2g06000-like [Lotus japonicus]